MNVKKMSLAMLLGLGGALLCAANNVHAAIDATISAEHVESPFHVVNLINLKIKASDTASSSNYNGKIQINWGGGEYFSDADHETGRIQVEDIVINGVDGTEELIIQHAYFRPGTKNIRVKIKEGICATGNCNDCLISATPATIGADQITIENSAFFHDFKFNRNISQQGQAVILKDLSTDSTWEENVAAINPITNGVGEWIKWGLYFVNWGDGARTFHGPNLSATPNPLRMTHYYDKNNDGDEVTIEYHATYCNGPADHECDEWYSSGPIKIKLNAVENKLPMPDYALTLQSVGDACVLKIVDQTVDPDFDASSQNPGWMSVNINNLAVPWFSNLMTATKDTPREFTYTIPTNLIWVEAANSYKSYLRTDATGTHLPVSIALLDNTSYEGKEYDLAISMPWESVYVTKTPEEIASGAASKCQVAQ